MANILTKKELLNDLLAIGVKQGDLLHLKVSLRSVGKMKDGARTLLDALIEAVGKEGTIVVDSFVTMFPLPLSKENSEIISDLNSPTFAGAFANEMVKHPDMFRSYHPVHRFTAIGKHAKELTVNHTVEDNAYKVLVDMVERGAKNLTIGDKVVGVGTTHVALEFSGIKQKKISNYGLNYRDLNGNVAFFKCNWDNGEFCSDGYWNFMPLYECQGGIIKKDKIGNAMSILTDMQKTLEIEVKALKNNHQFFMCNKSHCRICRTTWNVSENRYFSFLLNRFVYGIKKGTVLKSLYLLFKKPNKTG